MGYYEHKQRPGGIPSLNAVKKSYHNIKPKASIRGQDIDIRVFNGVILYVCTFPVRLIELTHLCQMI
jgi:hypothetical protein